jgi:hypothetical protein
MGLAALKSELENKGGDFDRRKTNWLSLKDGESVELWLLNELDESAEHYNPDRGTGNLAVVWQHPDKWQVQGFDTTERDGADWKQEQGWKRSKRFYVNVLVVRKDGSKEVAVWNLSTSKFSPLNILVEYAEDDDGGSVTNQKFKLTRKGTGKDNTTYTLLPKGAPGEPVELPEGEDFALFDLEEVIPNIPYDKQEQAYTKWLGKLGVNIGDPGPAAEADDEEDDDSPW